MNNTFNDDFLFDFSQIPDLSNYADLPPLDFDASTLQSLADATSGSSLMAAPQANMQVSEHVEGHNDGTQPPQPSSDGVSSEELRQALQHISSRLEDLERAVSAGNCQLNEIGFNIDRTVPKLLSATEDFRGSFETLRKSLQVFTRELVNHLLGWSMEDDVEAGLGT
ncbi:hypothetical protein FALBO_4859 [Fusarium albosuccineum]|uniref:Uncharacterized protein n=1 Tax=Fusarium albosuccineum TaxID=1237068 RepID=A0A8H4PD89_9HYPO|nr:hypothetical protein FALBO_4859 [Fusarium albosuccineum]